MFSAKNILIGLLTILSACLGLTLGQINLYELISGAIKLNIILFLISILLVYFQSICLFILGLTDENTIYRVYGISAAIFGICFFAVSQNILSSILSLGVFWWMEQFIYSSSKNRAALFVKFIPSEIFMPALRTTFVYLMIFFSLISFVQTRDKISQNTLINDTLISFVSKPLIPMINKQLNSQVIQKLGSQYTNLPYEQKREVAQAVLREVVTNLADKKTGTVWGISPSAIPVQNVYVSKNGDIDIAPVIAGMYPQIKNQLLLLLSQYGYLVPIIVALLVVLIIQPVFILFNYIETWLTLLIFWILIDTKILKITQVDAKIDQVKL